MQIYLRDLGFEDPKRWDVIKSNVVENFASALVYIYTYSNQEKNDARKGFSSEKCDKESMIRKTCKYVLVSIY